MSKGKGRKAPGQVLISRVSSAPGEGSDTPGSLGAGALRGGAASQSIKEMLGALALKPLLSDFILLIDYISY